MRNEEPKFQESIPGMPDSFGILATLGGGVRDEDDSRSVRPRAGLSDLPLRTPHGLRGTGVMDSAAAASEAAEATGSSACVQSEAAGFKSCEWRDEATSKSSHSVCDFLGSGVVVQ